jgi:hypothetical protein
VGLESIISIFHFIFSAYREYILKISAAKSAASPPPVPARISTMAFFSESRDSLTSVSLSTSRAFARSVSADPSSSFASSTRSASSPSLIIASASSIFRSTSLYARYLFTTRASAPCSFA